MQKLPKEVVTMRTTKLLLAAAAISAAGWITANAQQNVYSQNVVGYINVTIPAGKMALIANQLWQTNMTLENLLPNAPEGLAVYKYTGSGWDGYEFIPGIGWVPDGSATLAPGEGAMVKNPSGTESLVLTFVGEVMQGSLTNQLPAGLSVKSLMVPIAIGGTNTLAANGFPAVDGDCVYKYASGVYEGYEYMEGVGWVPEEPTFNVGEAFFVKKNAPTVWVRNFTVQ